ncbi:uncharacterized protein [Clytia hemisphaerica]|uniref:Uncharacterized protein n=1 Tax=Clytia hemisphaerica TaxID=252671 RepID=A0A7M5XJS5_9CNID
MRKPRYTIFLGYGEEAESLLKLFEQVKCRTGISSNIPFIKLLLTFFERSFNGNDEIEASEAAPDDNSSVQNNDIDLNVSKGIYEYPNSDQPSNILSAEKLEDNMKDVVMTKEVTEKKYQRKSSLENNDTNKSNDSLETIDMSTLRTSSNLDKMEENYSNNSAVRLSSFKDCCHNNHERESTIISSVSNSAPCGPVDDTFNNMDDSMACAVAKSICCTRFDEITKNSNVIQELSDQVVAEIVNVDEPGPSFPPKMMKIDEIKLSDGMEDDKVDEDLLREQEKEEIPQTPLDVINKFMEHVQKELDYYHGFISSGSKLREFLEEYRKVTNMVFTVRSSRSYIKKRAALNSNILDAAHQTLGESDITEERALDENNMTEEMDEDTSLDKTASKDRTNKKERKNSSISKPEEYTVMDSIMTGPLRWEYDFGMPPIPFTGTPFCIIGNTHYKCFYACPDSRTLRKRKLTEDDQTLENMVKKRSRRSLKRDCKAMMCIKSIVCFPEHTVKHSIQKASSKKACRKLKASALNQIRDAFLNGEAIGHPAFWLHVPLPEAHTTHDLFPENVEERLIEQPTDSMDAITHILSVAARYGSKVQMSSKGTDNVLEVHLNQPSASGEETC